MVLVVAYPVLVGVIVMTAFAISEDLREEGEEQRAEELHRDGREVDCEEMFLDRTSEQTSYSIECSSLGSCTISIRPTNPLHPLV